MPRFKALATNTHVLASKITVFLIGVAFVALTLGCRGNSPTAYDYCNLEAPWELLDAPPEIADDLLAGTILNNEVISDVLGIDMEIVSSAWFAVGESQYLACTYTEELNECGFNSVLTRVEFRRENGIWRVSGPFLDRCG